MTISIDLSPDLENQLREQTLVAGIPADKFVADAVTERLQLSKPGWTEVTHLAGEESRLLEAINRGLPESTWGRYHQLMHQRRAGKLTAAEHEELISLSDEIEIAHAKRLENVVLLARLRNLSAEALMDELGIQEPWLLRMIGKHPPTETVQG